MRRAGMSADHVESAFTQIERQIDFAAEPELGQMLSDAGFEPPTRFYQALLWGGWWTRKS